MRQTISKLRRFVHKAIFNRHIAALLLKPTLQLHSLCYYAAGQFAIALSPNGLHPKHEIIRYKEWFLAHIDPGSVVLDIGSNTGVMPLAFSEKAAFVYGIELDPRHVAEAESKRSANNITYLCGDATAFDYSQCRPIDYLTLSNVLEHIEYRQEFLRKLISSVRWKNHQNRKLLIRVPQIEREWTVILKKNLGLEYRLDDGHYVEYTLPSLREELAAADISIVEQEIRFGEILAVCRA